MLNCDSATGPESRALFVDHCLAESAKPSPFADSASRDINDELPRSQTVNASTNIKGSGNAGAFPHRPVRYRLA
jgi:hypothetical protein